MTRYLLFLFSFLVIQSIAGGFCQGIFESSLGRDSSRTDRLSLSGYTRGTAFLGLIKDTDPLLRSLYSETSLKIKARAGEWGQAFSDIRFRTGNEFANNFTETDIREAYVDLFLGMVEFRVGKQISAWGRADGFNPTNNLTPQDYFVRSPDVDEMRLGNYLIRGRLNPFRFLRLEADVVPWHASSVYRFDLVGMPDFVKIDPVANPGFVWDKSSFAAKLDFIFDRIEGSVSWFNGYDPMPALKPGTLPAPPFNDFNMTLTPFTFRQQTFGADFTTIILNTGIRGEIGWKKPEKPDSTGSYIPNEEIQWVAGIDRELGPVRIIASYMGKYVPDFVPADPPQAFDPSALADPNVWPLIGTILSNQISYYNRILFDQTHELSHTILFRPSIQLFHETFDLEVTSLWNIVTEEYMIYPKMTYHFGEGLEAILGYQYYNGPDNTRFKWIKDLFNGPFFELKLNF